MTSFGFYWQITQSNVSWDVLTDTLQHRQAQYDTHLCAVSYAGTWPLWIAAWSICRNQISTCYRLSCGTALSVLGHTTEEHYMPLLRQEQATTYMAGIILVNYYYLMGRVQKSRVSQWMNPIWADDFDARHVTTSWRRQRSPSGRRGVNQTPLGHAPSRDDTSDSNGFPRQSPTHPSLKVHWFH